MTLWEKIYQLFVVTPDQLTNKKEITTAGQATKDGLENTPVGGLIYFENNIKSKDQIAKMISQTQSFSGLPLFICVDEEGGRVSRLSGIGVTDKFDPMAKYGEKGDTETVYRIGSTLGAQIQAVGFNVDFAPVADIVTNPNNKEIGNRSFSSDPMVAAKMVAAMVSGLQSQNAVSCLKHFPGHGSTEADSHKGMSVTNRTLEELRSSEWIPFRAGISAGVDMIMISHMSAPAVTGDNTPCDLSSVIVTDLLRGELGYQGVVVTDAHNMGAITSYYGCGKAAVMAISAGCDIVLMPKDLQEAANAIMKALEAGNLTEERINESVLRILTLKITRGIIQNEGETGENPTKTEGTNATGPLTTEHFVVGGTVAVMATSVAGGCRIVKKSKKDKKSVRTEE